MPHKPTPNQPLIIATIERIGGGVVLPELAHHTGLEGIDLMAELEILMRRREVYPWAYTTPTAGGMLLGLSQTGAGPPRKAIQTRPRVEGDTVTLGGPTLALGAMEG